MTVQAVPPSSRYTASPGADTFVYEFKIRRAADLRVRVDGVVKTMGVDYTVTGVTNSSGSVVFTVPLIGGELVQLDRDMPYDRTTDFQNLGDLLSATLNNDQDDPVMMIQQLGQRQEYMASFPDTLDPDSYSRILPVPSSPLYILRANPSGNGYELAEPPEIATVADGAVVDATVSPIAGIQGTKLAFIAAGGGSIDRTVQDKQRERRTPEDKGAAADGVVDDRAAIVLADAGGPFTFTAGKTYRVQTSVTISSAVEFAPGSRLTIDSGQTVTFNGPVTAGAYQIFAGAGTAALNKNWNILPEWFGADPTASVDSTVVMQKAIQASLAKRLELNGIYLISAPLVISVPLLIEGKSKFNSGFKTNSATADIVQVQCGSGPLSSVEIRNILLDSTVSKTAGYGISILATSGGILYDGVFDNIYMTPTVRGGGMDIRAAIFLRLKDVNVEHVAANKIGFRFAGVDVVSRVVNVFMDKCLVRSGTSGASTTGMLIDSYCEGFTVRDCNFESPGLNAGVIVANGAGVPLGDPKNLWFNAVVCDTTTGHGWNYTGGRTIRMTDCWSTSCTLDGVHVGAVVDLEIKGHSSIGNGNYGIWLLTGAKQVRIIGGVFDANGQAASNTYAGIVTSAGTTDFTIVGADFYREGTTKTHAYDIQVLAGASDRYVIKNNRCRGWLSGHIQDLGSGVNKFVNENIS